MTPWGGALALVVVIFNAWAIWIQHTALGAALVTEHGPIEWVQVGCLVTAAWLFLKSYRSPESGEQIVGGVMAILCVAAAVRELDVRHVPGPAWVQWLSEHGLKDGLFILMVLPAIVVLVRKRTYAGKIARLAFRWAAWPMWLAGILVVGGIVFDSRIVRWYGAHFRFHEEMLELNGYIALIFAGYRHLLLTPRGPEVSSVRQRARYRISAQTAERTDAPELPGAASSTQGH